MPQSVCVCVCYTASRELHPSCPHHDTRHGFSCWSSCSSGEISGAARSSSGAQHTGDTTLRSVMWSHPRVSPYMMCICVCAFQSLRQLPAERVDQKEIPAEHVILKNTFSSLVQRCQLSATDAVNLTLNTHQRIICNLKQFTHDNVMSNTLSPWWVLENSSCVMSAVRAASFIHL